MQNAKLKQDLKLPHKNKSRRLSIVCSEAIFVDFFYDCLGSLFSLSTDYTMRYPELEGLAL